MVFGSTFFFLVVVLDVVVALDFTMLLESSDELELLLSSSSISPSDELLSEGGVRNEIINLT